MRLILSSDIFFIESVVFNLLKISYLYKFCMLGLGRKEKTSSDPNQEGERKEMSFLGHLEELRWRLIRIVLALLVCTIAVFIFLEPITDFVFISMSKTDFVTFKFFCSISDFIGMGDALCVEDIKVELKSIRPTQQFSTSIYLSIILGIAVGFPFFFHQIWGFVKPGLRESEVKATRGVIWGASVLFLLGIGFGYFLVSPLCVQFFSNWSMSDDIANEFTISSYAILIGSTTFASGIFFQLPVIVYILSKLGIVTPPFLKKYRRHAIIIILILSAIITPPDLISQVIVSLPVLLLYELSIKISSRVLKNKHSVDNQ